MLKNNIIIVDDDQEFAQRLAKALDGLFNIETCYSEAHFRDLYSIGRFDLIIMDMRLEKDREGLELLREVLVQDPMQAAVVMTAYADTETYVNALESGALTYLDKREFSPTLIARTVEALVGQTSLHRQVAALEQQLEMAEPIEIIGASQSIRSVREAIQRAAADGRIPVLVTGPPGAGKQLVARNIHRLSGLRSNSPFVNTRCNHLSSDQAIISLFGSFQALQNGRGKESKGWIDEAKGGILFLNGIISFDAAISEILLQFVESGVFSRVGGGPEIEADIQIVISAVEDNQGNPTLEQFRTKLLQQLGGLEIRMPSLRERIDDLPLLAQYALQNLYRKGQTHARSFSGSALSILESQTWPGNVHELNSAIEYGAIRADAQQAQEIRAEHLPQGTSDTLSFSPKTITVSDHKLVLARAELALVETTMDKFKTRKVQELAEKLGYNNRFTFSRRMHRNLQEHPSLTREFPNVVNLFRWRKYKHDD